MKKCAMCKKDILGGVVVCADCGNAEEHKRGKTRFDTIMEMNKSQLAAFLFDFDGMAEYCAPEFCKESREDGFCATQHEGCPQAIKAWLSVKI